MSEHPHKPDLETAFALVTAWRDQAPDLRHPEEYRTDGLASLFSWIGVGEDPWNVILGLVALCNQLLVLCVEASATAEVRQMTPEQLLGVIAQMHAEAQPGSGM